MSAENDRSMHNRISNAVPQFPVYIKIIAARNITAQSVLLMYVV